VAAEADLVQGGGLNASGCGNAIVQVISPCIAVTKQCALPAGQSCFLFGQPVMFAGVVTNCGDTTLFGISLSDSPPASISFATTTSSGRTYDGTLLTNESIGYTGNYIPASCGPQTDTIRAIGTDVTGRGVTNTATVTCPVCCPPDIEVSKQVACAPPGAVCGPGLSYGETATGVAGAGFCYRIIVMNNGNDILTNVTVTDPDIPGVAGGFPTTLGIGQRATNYFPKTWGLGTHVNTVTAAGRGLSTGILTNDNDTATAIVVPVGVSCDISLFSSFDMDNNPNDNQVSLPDGAPVQFAVTVNNTGQADLNVNIVGLPCSVDINTNPIPTTVLIPAGGSAGPFVCDIDVTCPDGTNFSVTVTGTAVASASVPCVYDSAGNAITTASSTCTASVRCAQPVTCRVTGGGVLLTNTSDESCITVDTTIFPLRTPNGLLIKKITHGGQLGAPFSQEDCGEILGNPCIRGQWQHVRHYQGKANPRDVIDMNFHSVTPKGVFDSLNCACLGCCDPETGAFITPIQVGSICNPDDHKVCGPQPRPAPANAIIFSGIGRITPEDDVNGNRAERSEWVVFRVYIEDRSEPGGFHPKGSVQPADIYCFQAWKTGIKVSKKPDFSTISAAFRQALGQANCEFLEALQNGALPIGSLPSPTVEGVTADIQDCGPMHDGNHQIHPSTSATCDE
jgi:uncharacterized repeat protein (TIGR01451 family)